MLKRLLLQDVSVSRNHRRPLPGRVASVARSMREIGQLHPITVNADGNRLIAGRTRMEAAKALGWKDVLCSVVDFNKLQAELAEIDENIERSNLTALEEAQALARRKAIYEELYPETQAGIASGVASQQPAALVKRIATAVGGKPIAAKISATGNPPEEAPRPSFAAEAAESLGVTERSIRTKTAIGENLVPAAAAAIRATPIADNQSQLERLSRLPEDDQVKVAEAIKSGEATTVQEASAQVNREIETADDDEEPTLDEVMKEKNSEIECFCRRLVAMAEAEMPTDRWITKDGRGETAMQKIRDACSTLRSCKCVAECPKCKGEGCARCVNTGRVTRYALEQMT